jgi:hypothetical protein
MTETIRHFRVRTGTHVWILVGHAESNVVIGRSRVLDGVWLEVETRAGDELHDLFGNAFFVFDKNRTFQGSMGPPYEPHPFVDGAKPRDAYRKQDIGSLLHEIQPSHKQRRGYRPKARKIDRGLLKRVDSDPENSALTFNNVEEAATLFPTLADRLVGMEKHEHVSVHHGHRIRKASSLRTHALPADIEMVFRMDPHDPVVVRDLRAGEQVTYDEATNFGKIEARVLTAEDIEVLEGQRSRVRAFANAVRVVSARDHGFTGFDDVTDAEYQGARDHLTIDYGYERSSKGFEANL